MGRSKYQAPARSSCSRPQSTDMAAGMLTDMLVDGIISLRSSKSTAAPSTHAGEVTP
jgi:hypothetical protein